MAKLLEIIETPEAITAEATAFVWEEYEAPRKRIKRVRPVEHHFAVSIPKATKDAAPLAFVVEYFPEMVGRRDSDKEEYRPGHDQQIRSYKGKLYTPARFSRHPYYTGAYIDPRGELERAVKSVCDIAPYDIAELLEQASRDEIRADKWHYYGHVTAESVTEDAAHVCNNLIVIDGQVWKECDEPVYIYHAPDSWQGRRTPAFVTVSDDHTSWGYRNGMGARDMIAMTFYHGGTERHAYIRVLRHDLVTIDSTARDLESDRDRQQRYADEAAEKVERLEKELAQAREDLAQEREDLAAKAARLETYQSAPLDYWRERIGEANESVFCRIKSRAAATARLIEKEV